MEGGAILHGHTSTCLNLHSRPLPSTGPELYLFSTGGKFSTLINKLNIYGNLF